MSSSLTPHDPCPQAPSKIKVNDQVWLRGGKSQEPFVPAAVTNVQQNGARVTVRRTPDAPEETLDTSKHDIFPANEKGLSTHDHCALIHLNEPSVLENSKLRFANNEIYTYTGKILVALNPFGALPIYGCTPQLLQLARICPPGRDGATTLTSHPVWRCAHVNLSQRFSDGAVC